MVRKKLKLTRRPRTLAVVAQDLRTARLCRTTAVAEGDWDAADRLQRKLDWLQEEAAALASATTQGI